MPPPCLRTWLLCGLALIGGPACRAADAQVGAPPAAAPPGKAPHGSATMDQQLAALAGLGLPAAAAAPRWSDPVIWASSIPPDNLPNEARILLGKKLYFDPRLSADGTVACATCHDVTRGFTDQRPMSEGIGGKLGRRNAPTSLNAALLHSQFLDGRAANLETQAILPIINPIEMGQPDGAAATAAIAGDPEYQRMFQAAYGRSPSYEDIGRALASFERTLMFLDAPFDRWARGDGALPPDAIAGFALFNGKARCAACHPINQAEPLGSDGRFHNIGVAARHHDFEKLAVQALGILETDPSLEKLDELALETDLSELGRFLISRQPTDIGAFRTSQLRNVGITGPYMHDGSMQTLWDVMDHYNKGGEINRWLDGGVEPLALSEQEIDQVVAFLFSLTDVRFAADNDRLMAAQKARAASQRPLRDDALASRAKLAREPKR